MFTQTADQELFEATTVQFLAAHYPPSRIRELRAAPSTFDRELWRRGAELGWTSLLVPEQLGGGAISDNGLLDLMIVAFQFGRHAAPGPLLGTNAVAYALSRWGSLAQRQGPLVDLLTGEATAAWAGAAGSRAGNGVVATADGHDVLLNGTLSLVDGAADIDHLLLAVDGNQPAHYLFPMATPGIELMPLEALDLTRRFQRVTFQGARIPVSASVGAPELEAGLVDVMAVLQSGEIVGAMHRAFEITLKWTFDRYSFGRPLASYQEIKHRVADLRTHLEASEAIALRAARAVGEQSADASSWAAAAKSYVGRHGPEVIQDCMQLHGGIGVTFEHDLHLFLRRAATNAQLFGAPDEFSRRVARLIEVGAGA